MRVFEPEPDSEPLRPTTPTSTSDLWAWALASTDPDVGWNGRSMNLLHRSGNRVTVELHPGFVNYLDVERRRDLFAERYAVDAKQRVARLRYEVGGRAPVQRAMRRLRDRERLKGQPMSEAARIAWAIVDGRYKNPEALAEVMRCGIGRVRRLAGIGLRRLHAEYLNELNDLGVCKNAKPLTA